MPSPWITGFLVALRRTGVVARACEAAGVGRSTVEALRARDADFAAAFEEAREDAIDMLEAEAWQRAKDGTPEPLVHQGAFNYEVERDAAGNPVIEHYDTGVRNKDGDAIVGSRTKLLLRDGKPVPLVVHKKSDALLQFLLKGHRKKVYAERTEVTGADGGPVQMDSTARAARIAQLMAVAKQRQEHGDIA